MVSAVSMVRHFSGAAPPLVNPTIRVLSALTSLPKDPAEAAWRSVQLCGFPKRAKLRRAQLRAEDIFRQYKEQCAVAKAACLVPGLDKPSRLNAQLLKGPFDRDAYLVHRAIQRPQEAAFDLGVLLLYLQQPKVRNREEFGATVQPSLGLYQELREEGKFFAEASSYAAAPFVDNLTAYRSVVMGGFPDMAAGYLKQALYELARTITFHREEDTPKQAERVMITALVYLARQSTIFSRRPVTETVYRNMTAIDPSAGHGPWSEENAPTAPELLIKAIEKTARAIMTSEGRPAPAVGLASL